jgi:Putative metallopeptidase
VIARPVLRRSVLAATLLVASVAVAACEGDETAETDGQVRIVYHDDAIEPENREVANMIRQSGVIEQLADGVNRTVALRQDLTVNVTDAVPPGVTDAVTQPFGETIFMPPAFFTQMHALSSDIVSTVERPAMFPENKYNADDLTALSTQFIFGHEMGHALQRNLQLANLGLEEDAADGFASFFTVNEVGPDPSIAAAILFDALARQEELTLEGLSSDHPVTQQRVFNFLCLLDGSDPERFDSALVGGGYIPESRAPLCAPEWAALDYGWWTQLEPHFTEAFQEQGTTEQEDARAALVAATKAMAKNIDELRTAQ